MRKFLMSIVCMMFATTGLIFAAEVLLVKHDETKKEVTVKDGDKEVTYKYTDKTKVTFTDQDGNSKEATVEDAAKTLSKKNAPGKLKFEVTTDGDTITEMKLKYKKK